jgi:hypothetical protein
MAFTYTDPSGYTLIVPDSAVTVNVASNPTGIATTGVVALVGEADQGPAWDDPSEGKLANNVFGPGDISKLVAKYGTGRLIDAFRAAVTPSASQAIQGAPQSIVIVKVNEGVRASKATQDNHGMFVAKLAGQPGNLIYFQIQDTTLEAAPTSGQFSYVPNSSGASLAARVNGGAKQTLAISANETPAALASALTSLSGINAVGGTNRLALGSGGQVASLSVSGQNVNVTLTAPTLFSVAPQVGDTMQIPSGSVLAGSGNANVGWYVVTAISNTTSLAQLSATKITAGAPVAVSSATITGTPSNDLIDWSYLQINNLSGTDRQILTGLTGQTITSVAVGSNLTMTLAAGQLWASSPRVGDWVSIPSGSAFAGAGNANIGWYQITSTANNSSSAFITMSRLSNGSPVSVASTPIAAISDVQDLDQQIKGAGKTMELYDNGGATNVGNMFLNQGTTSAASFLGTLLESDAQLQKTINLVSSTKQENYTVGGNIVFSLGYNGTTASASINQVSGQNIFTTTVTGGQGANLSINLSQLSTINDLVNLINSNTGYSASLFSSLQGQRPISVLDQVQSIGIASDEGFQPGEIKSDLYDLTLGTRSLASSQLAGYGAIAKAGLPSAQAATFLANGAKGGSTGLDWSNAIDALAGVTCNFVVPLVSQDATLDIASGLTDPSSTYTVRAVNSLVKSHVIAMSTPKVKKHRSALCSIRDTFANAQAEAQNLASFRVTCSFQDVFNVSQSTGNTTQFQPWMGAAVAAGMQAAGGYKAIFNKSINISGVIQAANDFDDGDVSDVEDALLAGLLPIQAQPNGGFAYPSDQTTYGVDKNFVYNSLQAVYVSDIMALSLAQSLKTAFVGQSVADVSAALAVGFCKAKMAEFLHNKYTVATAKAPGGYNSIDVQINAGVMSVKIDLIEAGAIYFIPIDLTIEGISTSASA